MLLGLPGVLSSLIAHCAVGDRPRWSVLPEGSQFMSMSDSTREISKKVLTSAPNRVLLPAWEQECVFWSQTDPGSWHLQFCKPACWEQPA